MKIGLLIQMVAATCGLACFAASNEFQKAIVNFPDVDAREYCPDLAVASANVFIMAGETVARAELRRIVEADSATNPFRPLSISICHMCRLVFTPTNSSELLRLPRLGGSMRLPDFSLGEPSDWPELPFSIINEIPLSVNLGYLGSGHPEDARHYLDYCLANGQFRTRPFPMPTSVTVSNALHQLFNSPAWKRLVWKTESYSYDESYTKELLWLQATNQSRPPVEKNKGPGR